MQTAVKPKTKKEQVKELYSKINDRTAFLINVANKYDVAGTTLKNHWFSPLFSVPKKHIDSVIEDLKETLSRQSEE